MPDNWLQDAFKAAIYLQEMQWLDLCKLGLSLVSKEADMISLFNSCEVISEPGNLFRLSVLTWLPRTRRKNKSISNSVREELRPYLEKKNPKTTFLGTAMSLYMPARARCCPHHRVGSVCLTKSEQLAGSCKFGDINAYSWAPSTPTLAWYFWSVIEYFYPTFPNLTSTEENLFPWGAWDKNIPIWGDFKYTFACKRLSSLTISKC